MDMQAALRARLVNQTAAGSRVYWLARTQTQDLPAITLQTIIEGRAQHLKGFEELQQSTVQLDAWATSYAVARQVANEAIDVLAPAAVESGVSFSRTMIDRLQDLSERTETQLIYRVSMDLIIHHATA